MSGNNENGNKNTKCEEAFHQASHGGKRIYSSRFHHGFKFLDSPATCLNDSSSTRHFSSQTAFHVNKKKCEEGECKKIEGTVVSNMKNLELNDFYALVLHSFHEIRQGISLQLISADKGDAANGGKLGKPAHLGECINKTNPSGEFEFKVTFDWEEEFGVPGAFIIRNDHHSAFYLKTLTLENVPGKGRIPFVCNLWVYPTKLSKKDCIFFANESYLPSETPRSLLKYRKEELQELRGNGKVKGRFQEWELVYDYASYNDLRDPDKGLGYSCLEGSKNPYPGTGRTGRPDTDAGKIYERGIELHNHSLLDSIGKIIPSGMLKEIFRTDGDQLFKFPMPKVIKENRSAWRTDEEFAREMLAKVNPVVIHCLRKFPPASNLDPKLYGNQTSSISREDIKDKLDGLTIDEAINKKKLFILEHHDALMQYLSRINETSTKTYATRTLLFLKDDGTLKPLAIELSLPSREGDKPGAISKVYTPAEDTDEKVKRSIWELGELAKAYVGVNESRYHQLISHWLNSHAVIEPFVIASNRQLSVLHPIYKLLHPHFRDTMNINALSRQILTNAGGVLELTVFPAKYSMEMSSMIYKNWVFTEQALPEDLKKRGMAVVDPESPHDLRPLIEDYPYAVDGLEIWSAIKTLVEEYCSCYYKSDKMVEEDSELQSWWKELREMGHGDLKDKPWWPKMQNLKELTETCTIIIWVASALHATVNFGQYPYAGFLPNRPTISHRFIAEEGTPEYILHLRRTLIRFSWKLSLPSCRPFLASHL